jgi:hypothetical protein
LRDDHCLDGILHSWKSFSANQINKMSGLRGRVWHPESFNHIVRSAAQLERFEPIHARQSKIVAPEYECEPTIVDARYRLEVYPTLHRGLIATGMRKRLQEVFLPREPLRKVK